MKLNKLSLFCEILNFVWEGSNAYQKNITISDISPGFHGVPKIKQAWERISV